MDLSAAPACKKQKKSIILPPSLLSADHSSPFPNTDLSPTKELFQALPLQVDKYLTSGKSIPQGRWLCCKEMHRAGLTEGHFTFPGLERAAKPHWQLGLRFFKTRSAELLHSGCPSLPQLCLPVCLATLVLLCTERVFDYAYMMYGLVWHYLWNPLSLHTQQYNTKDGKWHVCVPLLWTKSLQNKGVACPYLLNISEGLCEMTVQLLTFWEACEGHWFVFMVNGRRGCMWFAA